MRLTSVELLTSAWCPYNCNYCYIPKTEALKQVHKTIGKRLKSGAAFDDIARLVGTNITHLGLWGTEPTLTLPIIEKKLPYIKELFPKLNSISFSTSLMQPERIVSFVKEAEIECRVQVSVDGPFSDVNRGPGTTNRIMENVSKLADGLHGNSNLQLRWKATLTSDNITDMVNHHHIIDDYESYFTELYNRCDGIKVASNSHVPTLMVPGHYTSDDGRQFAEYLRLLHSKGYHSAYTYRLKKLEDYNAEIPKRCMFSCSGGDSNCGVSDNLHICHRTFYCDIPEYLESLGDLSNWDVSNYERGSLDILKDYYMDNSARYHYVMRGYHDFWDLQVATTANMAKQLALCGQCDERFLHDKEYTKIFSYFMNTAVSCPVEGLLNTGSVHLMPVSMVRMFGNGAFTELLNGR